MLGLGYIGVYLCRKNLAVAVPLLVNEFKASREEIGRIASLGTLAYAAGKLCLAPLVDRVGGRRSFLASAFLVAAFGALAASSPTLPLLGISYALNRLAGSPAWSAMIKQVPQRFGEGKLALALGLLSLSYVFGGAAAIGLAGTVASLSGGSWRAMMIVPAVILAALAFLAWLILPLETAAATQGSRDVPSFSANGSVRWLELITDRGFLLICALSFCLTLIRETFNDWAVDLVKTQGGPAMSLEIASFLSLPFDLCGASGILVTGLVLGRLKSSQQRGFIAANLIVLATSLFLMSRASQWGLAGLVVLIGAVGFTGLGPYSLLAGYFSVRLRGTASAGRVSGVIDAVGYFAGVLAGSGFGWLVDHGGYRLGLDILAGLAAVSVFIALKLKLHPPPSNHA